MWTVFLLDLISSVLYLLSFEPPLLNSLSLEYFSIFVPRNFSIKTSSRASSNRLISHAISSNQNHLSCLKEIFTEPSSSAVAQLNWGKSVILLGASCHSWKLATPRPGLNFPCTLSLSPDFQMRNFQLDLSHETNWSGRSRESGEWVTGKEEVP